MTPLARRGVPHLLAALAAVTVLAITATTVAAAGPPVVSAVAPESVVANGQPMHVTLVGSGLTGTISVALAPAVPGLAFTVANDSTILLTLPVSTPPDSYGVVVTGTGGVNDPSGSPTFVVDLPASTAAPPPPPVAQESFAPTPQEFPEPLTGVVSPGAGSQSGAPSHSAGRPPSPLLLVTLGIVLGGIVYLLWGRPGRLGTASRQGLGAHLIGRPVQALRIGRICVQCGRLHFILGTRRDLWRAGHFCSATCFVAAQEEDTAARAGETAATLRMKEMFVYPEFERTLQQALAGDVHEPSPEVAAEPVAEVVAEVVEDEVAAAVD